ncbi:MAG: 50S ribosomal protein L11 methyltransferase [Lachnospiraceae bacterium]|nr:50S ribosomal protein L11 methyltransferase [Lachnospiraceae bacterium]
MKWTKFILETTTEAEDLVSAVLNEMGIEGIEIEDKIQLSEEDKKKMFIDILPELPPDDGVAEISFYCDSDIDAEALKEAVIENLSEYADGYNLGSLKITVGETEDKDWINNWKEFFHPFRIDDTIVIKPTWTELEDKKDGDMVIEIDPGTAFGSGSHETTKLCILNLKKYLKAGEKLLDVGCGSGILSIMGIKLGAKEAFGIDIDEIATSTSIENAGVNHIDKSVIGFATGNVLEDDELCKKLEFDKYDIVVANILADIIIPLSGVCGRYMRKDALFISSGIINTKEEAVKEALIKNNFEIIEISHMNDWVSIVAKLK